MGERHGPVTTLVKSQPMAQINCIFTEKEFEDGAGDVSSPFKVICLDVNLVDLRQI